MPRTSQVQYTADEKSKIDAAWCSILAAVVRVGLDAKLEKSKRQAKSTNMSETEARIFCVRAFDEGFKNSRRAKLSDIANLREDYVQALLVGVSLKDKIGRASEGEFPWDARHRPDMRLALEADRAHRAAQERWLAR